MRNDFFNVAGKILKKVSDLLGEQHNTVNEGKGGNMY